MPPIRHTLSAVNTVTLGGRQHFKLIYERDDGTRHGVIFPVDTLAWRAAELGIDPDTARDELLDVILHEPFMPPTPPANSRPASREEARTAHNGRVAETKRLVEITTNPGRGPDPLDALRNHPVTSEEITHRRRILAGLHRHAADPSYDPSAAQRNAEAGKAD